MSALQVGSVLAMDGDSTLVPRRPQQLIFENVRPATRLLEKRRQMYEVQDALESQKAWYAKEEDQFKKREEVLRKTDLALQQQLFRFNKFLQDNEAKRRRAETRAMEEANQIRQRDEEIRDLEKQYEESRRQCGELEMEAARNMKYENFLEMVKDSSDEHSEIQDLVTRYETLETANKDLMGFQTTSEQGIEDLRNEYLMYRKQQEMEMLAMTNRIAALSAERDEVMRQRQEIEHEVEEATKEDAKISLHFGQILMSVDNLYLRCTKKRQTIKHYKRTEEPKGNGGRGNKAFQQEDDDSFKRKQQKAVRQLTVILSYLKDFKYICGQIERDKKLETTKQKLVVTIEPQNVPEMVTFEDCHRLDRASHTSSSQGNTRDISGVRDISKTIRETTSDSITEPSMHFAGER